MAPTIRFIVTGLLVWLAAGPLAALTISEIMYNPAPDGVEFFEIYNEDAEARDLSHYYFSKGVTFQFPGYEESSSTFIRGKSFIVVTSDPDKLLRLYPYLDNGDPLFPTVVGPFDGTLDNAGEALALANPGGAVDAEVEYNNRGGWPSGGDGTGHSIILRNPDLDDCDKNENWAVSPLRGGSPGVANFGQTVYTDTQIVAPTSSWRFFRGKSEPSDPKEAWRQPVFDAGSWEEGPAPIGYQDACYNGTVLSDMMNSYISVYLRKTFEVPDPSQVDVLLLKVAVDDGFIAYLNGAEVARKNMNADTFDAKASGSGECTTKVDYEVLDASTKLVMGTNVLCIQVHNAALNNNDFGIIPEVIGRKGQVIGGASRVDVDLNELLWNTDAPWLELYNDQDAEQDLTGFFLSDEAGRLDKFAFPDGTKIPGRGYLVVDQTQVEASGIVLNRLSPATEKTKFLALSRRLAGRPPETTLQVVDAYRFRIDPSPATVGMSDARYPDGDRDLIISRVPTRGAANQYQVERRVVINEIMYHSYHPFDNDFEPGTDGYKKPEDRGEYIEIFNRSNESVDLSGWSFTKGVEFRFPPGARLDGGAYLVVARDPVYIRSHYGLATEKVLGPWFNETTGDDEVTIREPAVLADAGEKVELSDELGNPADSVRYADNVRWSQWADTRGSSLERIDPNQDGRRASNWDASDETSKSEWRHYSWKGKYTEAEKELQIIQLTRGIILIDNLSVTDPANVNSPNYIQNGDFEKPLTAIWNIDGTHISSGRITYDKKDGEACLKIIATGRGNNRIDRIRVGNPTFPSNKELLLQFDAKWICGEANLLFCATWNTFAHRFTIEPPQKLGSPGALNSVRARLVDGNQGPLVEKVSQSPVLPAAGEQVVITAEVTDSDGVKDVKLSYGIDSVRAAATVITMLDDGQAPDGKASDGIFTAVIPGQAAGKRVLFSIDAVDKKDATGRFPYDDRDRTHPYLLDPATEDLTKLRSAIYIHGALGTSTVPEYRMLLHNENNQYLSTRHVMNNDVVDCSFVWNNQQIWYNVGVRHGNSPWTRPGGRSYVVKLPREAMLQGYKKFKLDNRGSEINERAVYYLLRSNNVPGRDGVPFGRSTYAKPIVNSAAVGSVFERVEIPGKAFVDRWWPNDSEGVLFKVDDKFLVNLPDGSRRENRDAYVQYPPDRSGNGEEPEEYRWYFMHRTRDKYDDFSELSQLAKFFSNTTPAATYDSQLFSQVNVEEIARTLAVEINVDDWDTWGTTRGKNCFFYRPRVDGRWTLIGWDKDLTFGNAGGLPLVPGMFPEVSRLLNSSGGKRTYYSILNDMLERFYSADYMNTFFNNHGKDANGRPITGIPGNASGPAGFLAARTGMIRGQLPRAVNFELITGGAAGSVTATEPSLVVEGNAPLVVWTVVVENPQHPDWLDPQGRVKELVLDVNQGAFTWTTTPPTKWKTTTPIPLANGANVLGFNAFDSTGAFIGSDELTVLYNVNWPAPQVTEISPSSGPLAGGIEAVVKGSGFHAGAKVMFGATAATVLNIDETAGTIRVRVPAATAAGAVEIQVQNADGKSASLPAAFTYGGARFNRGDVDLDGKIDLSDVINILNYQFFAGALTCLDAADVNDDGEINVTDPVNHLSYQFQAGTPPSAPFDPDGLQVGEDPTADTLDCQQGR